MHSPQSSGQDFPSFFNCSSHHYLTITLFVDSFSFHSSWKASGRQKADKISTDFSIHSHKFQLFLKAPQMFPSPVQDLIFQTGPGSDPSSPSSGTRPKKPTRMHSLMVPKPAQLGPSSLQEQQFQSKVLP